MARIAPVVSANTPAASAPLLAAVKAQLGVVPNMMATMAHAPSVLRGYLGLADALAGGPLSARERELIALAVGETNRCAYCVAAHATLGKGAGLSDAEVAAGRRAQANVPRDRALLQLAQAVAREHGFVGNAVLDDARRAGLSDGEIVAVVAEVALNVLTNTINHVAQTEVDFPAVPAMAA
jgi:uncharacterized peroxidase-related enzyme